MRKDSERVYRCEIIYFLQFRGDIVKLCNAIYFLYLQSKASSRESELKSGLLIGHAYSITDVRMVNLFHNFQLV